MRINYSIMKLVKLPPALRKHSERNLTDIQ